MVTWCFYEGTPFHFIRFYLCTTDNGVRWKIAFTNQNIHLNFKTSTCTLSLLLKRGVFHIKMGHTLNRDLTLVFVGKRLVWCKRKTDVSVSQFQSAETWPRRSPRNSPYRLADYWADESTVICLHHKRYFVVVWQDMTRFLCSMFEQVLDEYILRVSTGEI